MESIGLCRFSYPSLGGFKINHGSIQDRIDFLYGRTRLEERFRLFETITLPSIAAQTDPDFRMIVVIGDAMPKADTDRLYDITRHIPQIEIQSHTPKQHRPLMKDILLNARQKPGQPCLQWRLDDDDGVAVDFVEHLRRMAEDNKRFLKRHRCAALDFNHGYSLRVASAEISVEETFQPLWTAALGMYVAPHDNFTIMNFAHNRMAQFMPVISDPTHVMFLRSENGFNDSALKLSNSQPLTAEHKAIFKSRFDVETDEVLQAFSTAL